MPPEASEISENLHSSGLKRNLGNFYLEKFALKRIKMKGEAQSDEFLFFIL